MARRGSVKGIGRVRNLLRRLPDAVRGQVVVELHVTGRRMIAAVRARTPRKTGALAQGLQQKVFPRSLRLQVGLIGTPKERNRLFYGRIQDLGRKEQVMRVTRRQGACFSRDGSRRTSRVLTYLMRVRGMAPKRFITGRYPELRGVLRENLRGLFAKALREVGGGGE